MKKGLFVKRFIASILSILLVLTFVGCGGGQSANSPKDFEYEEVSGGLKITKYVGKSKEVVIPSVIDSKKVILLDGTAFSGNVMLKEITLPDTFTTVSFGYFKNCESLEKIVCTGNVSMVKGTSVLSTLPSFKSLEFYSIEEATLSFDLPEIIQESDTLVNIVIRKITEVEERDFALSEEEMGSFNIDREINVKMPQNMVDKYLEKTAYACYYISDIDNSLFLHGYKLCSALISGKDFNMPVIARNRALSKLSDEYKIEVSDLRFTWVDEEDTDIEDNEPDVYLRATAKYDGKNVIFVSYIGYAGDNWDDKDGWVFFDVDDSYEALGDETKLCLVFGVSRIKVNGVSYQIKNGIEAED